MQDDQSIKDINKNIKILLLNYLVNNQVINKATYNKVKESYKIKGKEVA